MNWVKSYHGAKQAREAAPAALGLEEQVGNPGLQGSQCEFWRVQMGASPVPREEADAGPRSSKLGGRRAWNVDKWSGDSGRRELAWDPWPRCCMGTWLAPWCITTPSACQGTCTPLHWASIWQASRHCLWSPLKMHAWHLGWAKWDTKGVCHLS